MNISLKGFLADNFSGFYYAISGNDQDTLNKLTAQAMANGVNKSRIESFIKEIEKDLARDDDAR